MIRSTFVLRHPAHLSEEQAQPYWRTNHGPIIRGVTQSIRMRRYLQVYRYEDALEQ